MSFKSEPIYSVTAEHRETGERFSVAATDAGHPDVRQYHYYCADCLEKGRKVAMRHVKGTSRTYKKQQFVRATERPALSKDGTPEIESFGVFHSAHWVRHKNAAKHFCDHPVRYAGLRALALKMSAQALSEKSFLFPLGVPQHGAFPNRFAGAKDLRSAYRPAGMKMTRAAEAKDFIDLLDVFEEDKGLQHYQFFHDGFQRRSFTEVFFEDPRGMHRYLEGQGAMGRDKSMVCALIFNPNTSVPARTQTPERDGFVDRTVMKIDEDNKMKLFVRATNKQSLQALSDACYRNGVSNKAQVLVVAQGWIDPQNPWHVEMEVYHPLQISPWDKAAGFVPAYRPGRDNGMVLAL